MFTDTVNSVTFDFTCTSETVAMGLQREILNYAMPQLNAVIENVLAGNAAGDLIQIDRIEIDLGTLDIKDLDSSILNDFKELFDAEIKKGRQASTGYRKEISAGFVDGNSLATFNQAGFNSISFTDARIELIREFLLYGDLPWWMDKKKLTDLDKIMQGLLRSEFEALKILFEHLGKNKQAITRLKSQFSAKTLMLFNALMPGVIVNDYFIGLEIDLPLQQHTKHQAYLVHGVNREAETNYFTNAGALAVDDKTMTAEDAIDTRLITHTPGQPDLNRAETVNAQLFNRGLKELRKAFRKKLDESADLKAVLIASLIKSLNGLSFYRIKALNILSPDEIAAIDTYLNSEKKETLRLPDIIKVLQRLTFFQVEFLLHFSARENSEVIQVELHERPRLIAEHDVNKEELKYKRIKQLLKLLDVDSDILFDELYKYPDDDLSEIEKIFKQYNIKNRLATLIGRLPHFISYNLLQIPVKTLADIDQPAPDKRLIKDLKNYKAKLEEILNLLPAEHLSVIEDVFSKGTAITEFERKAVINLLQKLPLDSLQVISKFALLNEDELTAFISYNNTAEKPGSNQKDEAKKIIVENAGLCLLAIYLPRLFGNLGYIENKDFKSTIHKNKALCLLEYIATGRQKPPEYMMQLNKVLCGLPVAGNITKRKRLSAKEMIEADDLLSSIIANWKALGQTSPNGFRNSFIQRKGLLLESEEFWTLQVEKKGYDVLIDSIPWSFSLIKLPWMKKRIHVEW